MANRKCPTSILCGLFPGEVDSPVLNVSSESPDQLVWIGTGYTPFNPWTPPPLGNGQYYARDCQGQAFSVSSQEIADLIAQIEAEACQQQSNGLQYSNGPQSVTINCAGGEPFTYTVPAGLFVSPIFPIIDPNATDPQTLQHQSEAVEAWIAAANSRALAYAQQQASAQLCCLNINHTTACFGIPVAPSGFLIGAHSNTADTYTMSVIGGNLPPGLTFVQTGNLSAELQGTPSHIGSYTFTVLCAAINASVSKTFTIVISHCTPIPCGPTSVTLDDAVVGVDYAEQLPTSGGPAPFTYTADPLTLPAWASVSSSGLVTGTPQNADADTTFTFDVTVTGSMGSVCTETVSVYVGAPGLDWTTLVWDVNNVVVDPGATGTGSASGDHFAFDLLGSSSPNPQANAQFQLHGSLTYNGPVQHCTLTMDITHLGHGDATTVAGFIVMAVLQDGNPIAYVGNGGPPLATGVNVITFDVADTGGNPSLIEVSAIPADGYYLQAPGWAISLVNGAHVAATAVLATV